jgi:hypothetical protein
MSFDEANHCRISTAFVNAHVQFCPNIEFIDACDLIDGGGGGV